MRITGRFWGADHKTSRINWDEFETTPITEDQLRQYLWTFDHKTKKFDVIPKYLFNFPS